MRYFEIYSEAKFCAQANPVTKKRTPFGMEWLLGGRP
jgi:hypothetical protein